MDQPAQQQSSVLKQMAMVVGAIVALYLVASVLSTALNVYDLRRRQAALENLNVTLTKNIEDMQQQIEYLKTDSFIEQAARSTLLWGRPGEKLLITPREAPQPTPAAVPTRRR